MERCANNISMTDCSACDSIIGTVGGMSMLYSLIPLMFFGVLCLWIGIGNWKERLSCKEEIQGVFLSCDVLGSGNHIYTCAKFEYTYNGRKIQQYTLERLSRKERKEFQKGETYTVYVDPQNPKIVRCTTKVFCFHDFFLVILGSFFTVASLFILLGEFIKFIQS